MELQDVCGLVRMMRVDHTSPLVSLIAGAVDYFMSRGNQGQTIGNRAPKQWDETALTEPGRHGKKSCRMICRLLLLNGSRCFVLDLDPQLGAVAADFRHVHRAAHHRQSVELSGRLGAEVVADFPNSLRQMVDK
jgi:hypothetical protein